VFGSTRNTVGIFQIILGLQRLAVFSRDVYWPWFKQKVLGLEEATQAAE
jgi:hypothetical protein